MSCKLQRNLLIRKMAILLHVFKTKIMKNIFLFSKPGNIWNFSYNYDVLIYLLNLPGDYILLLCLQEEIKGSLVPQFMFNQNMLKEKKIKNNSYLRRVHCMNFTEAHPNIKR